ncbi:MAG TPA: hypothetical protein VNX68_13095 [Nitrosopumilaceae archaeon]|jgi:hypothetical protein|nr:hypothetical protein [Nitrosopumilaceae archaeon]
MVDDNFVLKGGKYAGETYGSIKKKNPSYILWVHENAPNLLKEKKVKPVAEKVEPPEEGKKPPSAITPNHNFFNEGPNKNK